MLSIQEEEYETAMDATLDSCLECDLFSLNDEGTNSIVGCRMNDNPINCGGQYCRMNAS
jgi:hypothetical protein